MNTDALTSLIPDLQRIGAAYIEALSPPTDVQRMRELLSELCRLGSAPADTNYLPVVADQVPCEWVLAPASDPARRLVYLHGGGYVAGSIATHRSLAAHLAHATRCSVLNVDYRLAPEHPYDAPRTDAVRAFEWARAHGPTGAGPAGRLFVAGDSAGGGIAIGVAQSARDRGAALPDAVIMLSAAVDLSSMLERVPPEQRSLVEVSNRLFLGEADARDPIASPAYGGVDGLPPLLMQISDVEPAREENEKFAARARAAGVEVSFEIYNGMPHIWQVFAPRLPAALEAIASIGRFTDRFN